LLGRVRESYLRQAASEWVRIDADRDRDVVAADVYAAVADRVSHRGFAMKVRRLLQP
jgi:thymidylate kinase